MADVKASSWDVRFPTPVGGPHVDALIVKLTATPGATNDTLKVAQLTRNITILDSYVQHSDGDTNATPLAVFSLQVTDGTITKTIIHQSTAAQAGGLIRPTKVNATEDALSYTLVNENFWLRLLWDTGAATPASSTVVICVYYTGYYGSGAVTE